MVESVAHLRPVPNTSNQPDAPSGARREPLWRHLLGDELRQLRHKRGETLSETANRARVSPQYLSEMERGVKDASSEMVAAVASALDVTLVDLTLAVAEGLQSTQADLTQGTTCQVAFALAA